MNYILTNPRNLISGCRSALLSLHNNEITTGAKTKNGLSTRPNVPPRNDIISKRFTQKAAFTLAEVLITLGIIGVVAAITIPGLMTAYKKHVIETRLKHSYSLINQVVKLAQADYDDLSGWDVTSGVDTFVNTYFLPYMKSDLKKDFNDNFMTGDTYTLQLVNGTQWLINRYTVRPSDTSYYYHVRVTVDINGSKKPNAQGIDRFNFYIFPEARNVYNTGEGDCAYKVPGPGIYYDGYGLTDAQLRKYSWRACGDKETNEGSKNSFCIGLIVRNNWKIPANYPLKL